MSQRRLPAEIYWRRRLLLVAVVIAIVWGVLQLTGGGDDGEPAQASGTPTARASATATAPTTPAAPVQTVDGLVDVAVVSAATPCDPEKVRITPSVRPGQLTKGPVDIGLVVSSTEETACTLQPDDAEAIAVISANGTPVWDSTVCKTSLLSAPVQLSPQWSTLSTVQWTGRGSGSNCTSNQGWAAAGTYTLQIGTLGGEPGETKFSLDARPAPARTTAPPAAPATPDPAAPTTPAPTAPAPDAATSGTPEQPSDEPPVTPAD
ncbi:hypothetical protein IFT73_11175 [Aeromicrobium sp. CFBP 8757]|uniref:hypothetical protein n=1 Tax=Aeromicrobium sp. CFBP 8757 TaxID=2775288 RepID=UPI0017837BFB|nr:hypothetical protein [Aeromicrobium sp. CFBP 8757]MBD8607418.1 hypothetical protein [Aeromicrobium sp. CFBP 8757]